MTKTERIKILKRARKGIQKERFTFICVAVALSARIWMTEVFAMFPELLEYKPKHIDKNTIWFPDTAKGRQTRLKILDKVIAEIESKP